jgi:ribonuclease HII
MKSYHHSPFEIGIDEAGRGPFIGPVYASAVWWNSDYDEKEIPVCIMDSKKMTPKKRMEAREWIIQHAHAYGIGSASSQEIDELNILQATRLAMKRAIDHMREHFPFTRDLHHFIIDGVRWENKFEGERVTSIVGGDDKYLSIACASILAKEAHDEYIREMCVEHPDWNERYDLMNNMGYGTKKHREGLEKYGVCNEHRMSFAPCKKYIK